MSEGSIVSAPRDGLSVIVPAYNEEGSLEQVVGALARSLTAAGISPFEIVIVNDGSAAGFVPGAALRVGFAPAHAVAGWNAIQRTRRSAQCPLRSLTRASGFSGDFSFEPLALSGELR